MYRGLEQYESSHSTKSLIIQYISRGGAVWSARVAHNHKVVGSNPAPATKKKLWAFARSFFFVFGADAGW